MLKCRYCLHCAELELEDIYRLSGAASFFRCFASKDYILEMKWSLPQLTDKTRTCHPILSQKLARQIL